jgi:hypothetical protein
MTKDELDNIIRGTILISAAFLLMCAIIMGIIYTAGAVSFSGHFWNGYDTLTTSTELDQGNCNIDILMIPQGVMCGAFHDITMHESGHSIGNSSESMSFTNPYIQYSESFVSHDRDTAWQNSVDSAFNIGGYDIKTKIESFAIREGYYGPS